MPTTRRTARAACMATLRSVASRALPRFIEDGFPKQANSFDVARDALGRYPGVGGAVQPQPVLQAAEFAIGLLRAFGNMRLDQAEPLRRSEEGDVAEIARERRVRAGMREHQ